MIPFPWYCWFNHHVIWRSYSCSAGAVWAADLNFVDDEFKSRSDQMLAFGKVEKTDPRSADYPLTPLPGPPYGLPYWLLHGLPPRTTLNNQPNYFYGEEKHKKPTCSHVHDHNWKQPPFSFHRLSRPSLFHFRPILHRPPSRETLFPQWMIGRRWSL